MLGFEVGWNIRDLWKKGERKWLILPFLGNFTKWYQYQNRGGTGTTLQWPNGIGTKAK